MSIAAAGTEPIAARLMRLADWLAVATVVSLPWSTTATTILIVARIVVVLCTLDRELVERVRYMAAVILPVAIAVYAISGCDVVGRGLAGEISQPALRRQAGGHSTAVHSLPQDWCLRSGVYRVLHIVLRVAGGVVDAHRDFRSASVNFHGSTPILAFR